MNFWKREVKLRNEGTGGEDGLIGSSLVSTKEKKIKNDLLDRVIISTLVGHF